MTGEEAMCVKAAWWGSAVFSYLTRVLEHEYPQTRYGLESRLVALWQVSAMRDKNPACVSCANSDCKAFEAYAKTKSIIMMTQNALRDVREAERHAVPRYAEEAQPSG